MKAVRWEEIPDEDVRPGVRRRAIGTSDEDHPGEEDEEREHG